VVEFLAGGTLSQRLAAGPMPLPDVLGMGIMLAEGLHALHRAGVLHRDIKPSNIGFTADGYAKLLDFGIAKLIAGEAATGQPGRVPATGPDTTSTVEMVGTPAYMSPEAFRHETPGPSFDLWGLAVVAFEAFTGTNPFQGSTWIETVTRLESRVVADPRDFVSGCPDAFAEFLRTALAPAGLARPSSAHEFRDRLVAVRQATRAPATLPT
jgi:serine/threonine-protein kinase